MKMKKIIIGTLIATIVMLSTPIISSIEASVTEKADVELEENECSLCANEPTLRPLCLFFGTYYTMYRALYEYHAARGKNAKALMYKLWSENMDFWLSMLNCPNAP